MNRIGLTGLVKIDLPDTALRLCDGGFFAYDSEIYRSKDAVFGTIGALKTMTEGVGDEVPAVNMTLLPPNTTAPTVISQPGNQTSRVQFILAEYDAVTGLIVTAETLFDGQLDQTVLNINSDSTELGMSIVSLAERLFERNIGNGWNPSWHKSVWPGETGHDEANGLSIPVAWGTQSPTTAGSGVGGSVNIAGGGYTSGRTVRA